LERWPSGLRRTPGEREVNNLHPWVQIPLSPPYSRDTLSRLFIEGGSNVDIIEEVSKIASKICEGFGLELFDIKFKNTNTGKVLSIVIDNPNGYISTDDCERVSTGVEKILDKSDLIKTRYYLEVSSPGLDRPLRNVKDFERFNGSLCKIKTKDGNVYDGKIIDVKNGNIIHLVVNGSTIEINYSNIKEARLEI
jgi:ribosome maturation factor RimP